MLELPRLVPRALYAGAHSQPELGAGHPAWLRGQTSPLKRKSGQQGGSVCSFWPTELLPRLPGPSPALFSCPPLLLLSH